MLGGCCVLIRRSVGGVSADCLTVSTVEHWIEQYKTKSKTETSYPGQSIPSIYRGTPHFFSWQAPVARSSAVASLRPLIPVNYRFKPSWETLTVIFREHETVGGERCEKLSNIGSTDNNNIYYTNTAVTNNIKNNNTNNRNNNIILVIRDLEERWRSELWDHSLVGD